MTEPHDDEPEQVTGQDQAAPPRLPPRPLLRPDVDPVAAEVFARPPGVAGPFAPPGAGTPSTADTDTADTDTAGTHTPSTDTGENRSDVAPGGDERRSGLTTAPPPPEALATAFSRPPDSAEVLQRPPPRSSPSADGEEPWWRRGAAADPWRDPEADAVLGQPAVDSSTQYTEHPQPRSGARLTLWELFGHRVSPGTLAMIGALILLIAAVGGFLGRITAEGGNPLHDPNVTLAQVEPAIERPTDSVAAVAERVLPAVVSVEFRTGEDGGFGSGVVIDSGGYLLTNNHVVAPAAASPDAMLEVVFSDGTRVPAEIVGRDPKTDLAVLKVDVANPTVAQLGRSELLRPGDAVIAIGSPLGLAGTVTTGIVSAVDRPVRLEGEPGDSAAVIDAIQTDAAINPGNSGGALVDRSGAVVGINTAIRTLGFGESGGSIGLGFAIPIDEARSIAEQLIRTGSHQHPDLGVNVSSVTDGVSDGARVQNVRQHSAAAEAGIQENDVITKVGDRTVSGADELVVAIREREIGEQVPISLVRDGRPLVVNATLKSD